MATKVVVYRPIMAKDGVLKAIHGIPLITKVAILGEPGFRKAECDTLQIY